MEENDIAIKDKRNRLITQYETSNDTSGHALTSLSEKKYKNRNKKLIPDLIKTTSISEISMIGGRYYKRISK